VRRTAVLTTLALAAGALAAPLLAPADAAPVASVPPASSSTHATSGKAEDGRSRLLFRYKDPRITESSGIESSTRFRNVTYTHNDSGDEARFFAIGRNGGTRAVFTLPGATHYDWEDMSAGPRNTLWFGDIGSNASKRGSVWVYRVKEPRHLKSRSVHYTGFEFRYGDGENHNAEALLVNPRTGALMIVTKALSGAAFYRARPPFDRDGVTTLKKIGPAPSGGKITAGSFSPDGKRLVIRNYVSAFFYPNASVRSQPSTLRLPSSGESLAYARYRPGVIIGSEGVHAPVYRVTRP
jgi:hypothetical protein